MDRHIGRDHKRREGRALRPPSTTSTTNDTRVATPCPPRGRTDTVLHAGEPPLHLGHEIGSRMSTRPAEVANHHKPPPTCPGNNLRQPNPSLALSLGKVGPQH
jgi:hypothetical protein